MTNAVRIFKNSLLLTTALICLAVPSSTLLAKEAATPPQNTEETYKMLKLFGEVFERVRGNYVDEVTDKDLIEYAISGMLTNLDPHSSFLNDKSFEDMKVQTRGSFGGLGIEVTMENGLVKVVSPIDETPAYRAGVKAGDLITHLDGKPVIGLSLNDAVDKMRGKVGTGIEITLRRENVAQPIKVRIVRDIIKIRSVRSSIYGDVGYIRITTFNQQTEPGLRKAIEDAKKQLGPKLLGFVLDLRNNPGGLLDQAIAVSDDFLEKGEIVSTRGRAEEDIKRDNATPGDLTDGLPLVVLINGGSASASEIVSGALQDHRRAILMGTKSFGKGSVQTIISMPGDTAIRLTTARYYTPSGRSIQAKGIEPDIVVEPAKIETLEEGDSISEADLKGALKGDPNSEVTITVKPDPAPTSEGDAKDGKEEKKTPATLDHPDLAEDYQLARAVDLLRGIALYGSQRAVEETLKSAPAESAAAQGAKDEKSDKKDDKSGDDKK